MDKPEIRITRERLVYSSEYGCLYDDEVEFLPQGAAGTYLRWQWRAPFSVAVLPVISASEILLVESFRHSARCPVLEVPKGFGRVDVSPIEVAVEELAQEAGLRSKKLLHTGQVFTDPAFAYAPFHLFVAEDCVETAASPEQSEVILRRVIFRIDEVPTLIASGTIQDAITTILLQQILISGNYGQTDDKTLLERD